MNKMNNLKEYRKELNSMIGQIEFRIKKSKKPTLNPYNISILLKELILSYKQTTSKKILIKISDRIRKFHDFYGWMSKGTIGDIGLCSGTFYRTAEYLYIDLDKRSGAKKDRNTEFGIHLEHSIPVSNISQILVNFIDNDTDPKDIFETIIKYSLCTGFSRTNEKKNIKKGLHKNHPEFQNDLIPDPKKIQPFLRYETETVIYSMKNGKVVPLNSTLEKLNNHLKDYKIFDWNFIKLYYNNYIPTTLI